MPQPEKTPNPLPLRLREVAEKRRLLKDGIVLSSEPMSLEDFDDTNAAQSIIIDKMCHTVMDQWKTPELSVTEADFYTRFAETYFDMVAELEKEVWQDMVQSVVAKKDLDINNLATEEAAILTLSFHPSFEELASSSQELFVELALHAEVYQRLLKTKFGKDYTDEVLYTHLREHLPSLLKRLIALDSVLIDFYRFEVPEQDRDDEEREVNYIFSKLDLRFFELNENGAIKIKQNLLELFKEIAQKEDIHEDSIGRTENRGCPFLISNVYDEFIAFAIEEFILQHKKNEGNVTS